MRGGASSVLCHAKCEFRDWRMTRYLVLQITSRGVNSEWPANSINSTVRSMIEKIDSIRGASPSLLRFERRNLYPALTPFEPRGPFYADNPVDKRIVEWHKLSDQKFSLSCYCSSDITVSGIGLLWKDDSLIIDSELMPPYWRRIAFDNVISDPEIDVLLPTRIIDEPCISAIGWGYDIYGHVIIEMIPRLLVGLRVAEIDGVRPKILLRSDAPSWLKDLITSFVGCELGDLVFFNPSVERVKLKAGIFPTYPYFGQGFHPFVQVLLDSMQDLPIHTSKRDGNFFIARSLVPNTKGRRMCINEEVLIDVASSEFGIETIFPEKLAWAEQVKLFRSANSVIGLSGSALHTAIFADRRLIVGTIGLVNAVQTHIASLRQQQMAYQVSGFDLGNSYEVPLEKFRRMADLIVKNGL